MRDNIEIRIDLSQIVPPCKVHNYEDVIRKGRAWFVCADCGADITLELVMLSELWGEE